MALPPKTAPCWQKLASGGMKKLRTSNLGAQMLSLLFLLGNAQKSMLVISVVCLQRLEL